MKIVLSINNKNLEITSFENLDKLNETFKKLSSIKGPLEAKIFAINESINSHKLSEFRNYFDKMNICSLCLYSNDRETILAGKSLKIDSFFLKEQDVKNELLLQNSKKEDDVLHEGTVRSGDRISSNGNL